MHTRLATLALAAVLLMPAVVRADDKAAALAAWNASVAEQNAAVAKAIQAGQQRAQDQYEAQQAEMKRARTKACDDSRPQRVANLRYEVDFVRRVAPKARTILAACRIVMVKTGATNVETGYRGQLRISPEERPAVTCSSLPKGVSKEEAEELVFRFQPGSSWDTAAVLDTGVDGCREVDLAVGLDTNVSLKDKAGVKRLLAWTPETTVPKAP